MRLKRPINGQRDRPTHLLQISKELVRITSRITIFMATSTNFDDLKYLIVRPENGGIFDLFKYLVLGDISSGVRFLESSEEAEAEAELVGEETADHRWVIVVSIIMRKIIALFAKPLEYTGYVVDFVLNLLSQNGNISGLLYNLFHGNFKRPTLALSVSAPMDVWKCLIVLLSITPLD